jgi:hypothetical protein
MDMRFEIKHTADDNRADHGDQWAGYFLRDLLRTDNYHQHTQSNGQGKASFRQASSPVRR